MRSIKLLYAKDDSVPQLVCDSVEYFSQGDETAFFNWLNSIECIEKIEGFGTELELTISSQIITDENLRDLIAIFLRYKVDLKQLLIFETNENSYWFKNKSAFWHKGLCE
jgi:hypothetical protein